MTRFPARQRPSILLFLAATLVFAPGQPLVHGSQALDRDSGNTVARVLAPTLEQGLFQNERATRAGLGAPEKSKRDGRDALLATVLLGGLFACATSVSSLCLRKVRVEVHRGAFVVRRRGPPLLQPA